MSYGGLTFINTTDSSTLSKAAAKRVRGHNTRNSFAARRERKRRVTTKPRARTARDSEDDGNTCWGSQNADQSREEPILPVEHYRSSQLLKDLRPTIAHQNCDPFTYNDAAAWAALRESEPTLAEAIMAIVARYYPAPQRSNSPNPSDVKAVHNLMADLHSQRALNMTIERFGTEQIFTDGVLETALTMALGERLLGNEDAWDTHMNGVAQMLVVRRSKMDQWAPPILISLLILDSANYIFGFPRLFHQQVVKELASLCDPTLAAVGELTLSLKRWRGVAHSHPEWNSEPPPREYEELWMRLFIIAKALQLHDDPCISSTARGVEIILRLHQANDSSSNPDLESIAGGLKNMLMQLPVKTCLLMDLTSFQLWLGAIVSRKGSDNRDWFVDRLRKGVQAMDNRKWPVIFSILERELKLGGQHVLVQLEEAWEDVYADPSPK